MTAHNLKIEQRPLDDLKQHPLNPRNGDIDLIAESLETNGQYKPIVVTPDGTILAGNHTYQAALSLSWETLATVQVEVEPDSPEATRIMLADNRTSDVGAYHYDNTTLIELLQGMDNLQGTGYSDDDVDALLTAWGGPGDLDALADEHGNVTADDLLVEIAVRVSRDVAQRWEDYKQGIDAADAFANLLP